MKTIGKYLLILTIAFIYIFLLLFSPITTLFSMYISTLFFNSIFDIEGIFLSWIQTLVITYFLNKYLLKFPNKKFFITQIIIGVVILASLLILMGLFVAGAMNFA